MPQDFPGLQRQKLWKLAVSGIGLGSLIALPLVALLIHHEGPWTGFLWDILFRLPFVLICGVLLTDAIKAARNRQFKPAFKDLLGFALFGALTTVASLQFARQLNGLLHFHRLRPEEVSSVALECHATSDARLLGDIVADLKRAEWYSPTSHGWAPYVSFTLRFVDGHFEIYELTEVLAEGRLVVRPGPGNAGLLVFPQLAHSLASAGLLRVESRLRFDNKGYYQAIAAASVCKPSR